MNRSELYERDLSASFAAEVAPTLERCRRPQSASVRQNTPGFHPGYLFLAATGSPLAANASSHDAFRTQALCCCRRICRSHRPNRPPRPQQGLVRVGLAGSRLASEAGHIALLVSLGQALQAPLRRGFIGHGRCSSIVLYPAMLSWPSGRAKRPPILALLRWLAL